MVLKNKNRIIISVALIFFIPLLIWFLTKIQGEKIKADKKPASIYIDANNISGPLPKNWKSLAQGGEEKGVRMLENVIPQISALYPRYIRIDHIYDYYDVISRSSDSAQLALDFSKLDATVCDIYHIGAKPFFVLGYMSEALSGDNSLVSVPKSWDEWSFVVQKTIEHYSGKNTVLCGQIKKDFLNDIYYEVWNEPDLETFGKWTIYNGQKDYKNLYLYTSNGAKNAKDVYHFFLGGPVNTALYKNWITNFLDFVDAKDLKLDFISWHHYSKNPDDFSVDVQNLNNWLLDFRYFKYRNLPKIISEWGYDSDPNPIADTDLAAAHTVISIRNLIEEKLEMAFAFEIKDGPAPRWGMLSYDGFKKPRYKALKLLSYIEGQRLEVQGEGSNVKAIASKLKNKISVCLVNYDTQLKNSELVPISFRNLSQGEYTIRIIDLNENVTEDVISITTGKLTKKIYLPPNSIAVFEIEKN